MSLHRADGHQVLSLPRLRVRQLAWRLDDHAMTLLTYGEEIRRYRLPEAPEAVTYHSLGGASAVDLSADPSLASFYPFQFVVIMFEKRSMLLARRLIVFSLPRSASILNTSGPLGEPDTLQRNNCNTSPNFNACS